MSAKVLGWTKEIEHLAKVAVSQPHAAYAAFTHGLSSRWTYLLRTIPDIQDLLLPLENAIHQSLIPALTGRPPCSTLERDLLALPIRLGGIGLYNPAAIAPTTFQASQHLTAPLVAMIIAKEVNQTIDPDSISAVKKNIRKSNRQRQVQLAVNVYDQLPPQLKRCVDLAKEKGSSSWLSVLPLEDHGFYLHKGEFRDALCLRYGWQLGSTPLTCSCGAQFSVDHAMVCHMGGFPTIRHNKIRDITVLYSLRSAVTLLLNLSSNRLVGKHFKHVLPTQMMVPDLTSAQGVFGTLHRMHSSTYGFSTQTHPAIVVQRPLPPTGDMNKQRSVSTGSVSERWSTEYSLPWCSPPLEEWDGKQSLSTNGSLICSLRKGNTPTQQ